MTGGSVGIAIGGVARVYCVHDREKREVRSPDDAYRVAQAAGMVVDPHAKFQTCGCCENVFATRDDIPTLCPRCLGVNVHQLGGPLNGAIEGVL